MESELENLQLESNRELYTWTVEQPIKLCNTLQLSGLTKAPVSSKMHEWEELATLEDEGTSDLLNIQDMVEQVQMTTNLNDSATQSHNDAKENFQKEGKH